MATIISVDVFKGNNFMLVHFSLTLVTCFFHLSPSYSGSLKR